jgi:class 3 adenylate cyclase
MSSLAQDPLSAARDANATHDWAHALELFKQADLASELNAEDLESMGEAAWWAARPDEGIDVLQRAYRAYIDAGNKARAAYVALLLAREFGVKLEGAVSRGWFTRAKRLLESEPEGAEHGYLYLRESVLALNGGNADESIRMAQRAVEVGRRVRDPSLEELGNVYQGVALVESGEVERGLGLMDDAALAAVSGELSLYAAGAVYCNTIAACCEIADFRRAGDWTAAAQQWSERPPGQPLIPGDCRVHQAEVLVLKGNWAEAEDSARRGADELRAFNRLGHVGEALYQVGEIRRRRGDLPAARDLFGQASELGRDPQPAMALVLLAEGKVDASVASIKRALDEESSPLSRARFLPAAVEIDLRSGDLESAALAADELASVADTYQAPTILAAAAKAQGAVLLAKGDAKGAAHLLRTAITRWQELEAPYELAQARVLVARAIAALGDAEGAALELQSARSAFERLGAAPDMALVDRQLEQGAEAGGSGAARVDKTFLFTDIVKSTSLVEAIGDEAWLDLLRWHDQTLRALFAERGGREIDHAGDGFFVVFDEPTGAISCAIAIQTRLAEQRRTHGFAPQIRVGVHATPATRSAGGYRGKGVHEAARIGAAADAGEILTSLATLEASGRRFPSSAPHVISLKGFAQPVEVVAIDWRTARLDPS